MTQFKHDPIVETLLAPGGEFEVVEIDDGKGPKRVYAQAPKTLGEFISKGRAFGDAIFVVDGDERLSFDAFFEKADALAAFLSDDASTDTGDVIALAMRNSAHWMISFVAIVLAGRIPALVNSRGSPSAMAAAVEDSGAKLVIADTARLKALKSEGLNIPQLSSGEVAVAVSLEEVMDKHKGKTATFDLLSPEAQDVSVLFFTSGTTGRAKAAAISHRAMSIGMQNVVLARVAIIQQMAEKYQIDLATLEQHMPQASTLMIFPLFHVSGCIALFLNSLVMGGKLVLMNRWRVDEACRIIEAEKVTTFNAVPTMLWDLVNTPARSDYDLSSLSSFSSGGQAVPQSLLDAVMETFPNGMLGTGYGMTEAAGSVAQVTGDAFLSNTKCAGRILPMVDVKIVDEDGKDLGFDTSGEIWVRSANLMEGYWLKGEIKSPFQDGGWYVTGDIGYLDEDGYIYIVDRKTDMVISGGENIYCAEVQAAFMEMPEVKEVAAFGVPDDRLGEKLVLVVVSDEEGPSLETKLREQAANALGDYMRPKDYYIRSKPLPRNAMDKILKAQLRDEVLAP